MANGARTPNNVEVLAAKDSITGLAGYPTMTNRKLDVNATASLAGVALPIAGATTAVGVAIVDGSGNQITSFGGGTQYTDAGTPPAHPVGPTLEWNNAGTWATVGSAAPLPVTIAGGLSNPLPISGTVTANAGTNLNTSLLATSTNITGGGQKSQVVDGSGNVLSIPIEGSTFSDTLRGILAYGREAGTGAGAVAHSLITDSTGHLVLSALPAGTNLLGKVSIDQTTLGSTNNVSISGSTGAGTSALIKDDASFGDGVTSGILSTTSRLWNGTNYDRWKGDTTNGAYVNIKAMAALPAGSNVIGHVIADTGSTTVVTGTVAVTESGTWTVQPGNTANTTPWLDAPSAATGAVGTAIYNNTALSSTKQAANASAGNLYGYHIYNPNSVVIYIQLFNVASASVTVGSTAPTAVIAVPAGGWADATPGVPIAFATALTIAATTTSTGSGTPTTALLCNIWYK